MGNISPLLVLIVFILPIHAVLEVRDCNDVKYITIDDPRRSTAYSNFNLTKLCDRAIIQNDAWYRFSSEAGEEMPTTKPKFKSCGTFVPIWLNGSHPTIEEGTVARKACANVHRKRPFGCGYSYNIQVRNCSGYYIYQLKSPSNCYFAYCAGSKLPNCTNSDPEDYCLENRPPYISMPHRFYALEDSEFQLVFNATDPEGYPLRYSYLYNTTISSVSIDQRRKLVKISVKESGRVSLKVRDYGGLEYIHTVEVHTISCSCKNGGNCYNQRNVSTEREDFSNFKCTCVKPYTGRLCKVSPCDNIPCFPGVTCSVTDGIYKCGKCSARLQGDGKYCQLIITDDTVVIEGEMKIISGLKWNDDLLVKTSPFYKNQTAKIVAEIAQAYDDTKEFLNVVVIRYRKGSVVVEFQVALKENMNDPLKPLRTRAMQNKFGIFNVDQRSVKEENSTEVEGTLNVVSGVEWKDDLKDKSSSYFKTVSFEVAIEIDKIYANEKEFVYVFVTGFRSSKNKLVVEFKLVWRKKISNPLEKLQNETKDGKLGKLGIDKDSVKEITPTISSNDPSYFGLHKAVFIVVVCLVSVLALMSMVVCGICIRKKHVSIIMLTTHHDDRHEFCPNNGGEDSNFQMKKRPAHNQVVDIDSVGKNP